jgi:tetratricopeptide (TPR) repeat protein
MLQFLARELAESHILVVGAYRDVDPVPADPLAAALAELVREPVTQILPLVGLNESEVAAFIELVTAHTPSAGLAAAVHAETDGNPLFLVETVRLMAAEGLLEGTAEPRRVPVPQSVKDVIGRRLRRLSPECNRVLTLAAILGREFDLDVLGNVSGLGHDALLDALDESIAARVVADVPGATGRLRFAHALIRDTVYEALTVARRARLHGQVGAALETLYAGNLEPRLAELAHHYFEAIPAGFSARAAAYAQRAGERAASLLAYEEAVRLYELALELTQDGTARCELLLAVGDAQARAGDTSAAKESFREAADLAQSLELAELFGRAALGYGGRILWDTSRNDDALVPLLEGALAAVGRGDSAIRVRLMARLAGGPLRDARFPPERRVALSDEALSMARRLGDRATLAYALDGYISSRHSPEFTPEQVALATELLETAAEVGDLERAVEGHEHRLGALLELGEMKRAKNDLHAIVNLARELRQPSQVWYVAENRAMLALLEGRFVEAEELIGEALGLGQDAQPWNATFSYRLQLYVLRWEQERLSEISPLVENWVREYPTYPLWRCILAHMLDRVGRETEARSIFEALAADDFTSLPFDESWLVGMALLAETASAFGDIAAAATLYERLLPYADRVAVSYSEISTGAVARPLGILASLTLRWRDSERFFQKALDLNAKIGARPWVARTMREYACMLRLRHHPADAGRAEALLEQAETLRRTIDTPIPA